MSWILQQWALARSMLFYGSLVATFAFGNLAVGPFIDSPAYRWINEEIDRTPFIGELINVEGMLLEKLVNTTVPLFIVWSLVFFVYGAIKDMEAKAINSVVPILSIFTGGTGTLIALWGAALLGICTYGLNHYGAASSVVALIVAGSILLGTGFFLKAVARPSIVGRTWLHKHAWAFGVVFGVLGSLAYLYSIAAEPIQLIQVINDAYRRR